MPTQDTNKRRWRGICPALICLPATVFACSLAQGALLFSGSDGDWANSANWTDTTTGAPAGRLPGADDDVIIDGADVFIDPSAIGNVELTSLRLQSQALLRLLPGTDLRVQLLDVSESGLFAQASMLNGQEFKLYPEEVIPVPGGGWGCSHCGIVLGNPSAFDFERYDWGGSRLVVGLGGTTPASAGNLGPGYYATWTGDWAGTGDLFIEDIELLYGFMPEVGDTFQIFTVDNGATAAISGLTEGSIVKRIGELGLVISYQGGDGNDVVLTAVDVLHPVQPIPVLSWWGLMVMGLGLAAAARWHLR
jgi:hypothetical protein